MEFRGVADPETGFWSPVPLLSGGRYRFAQDSAAQTEHARVSWQKLNVLMNSTIGWRNCFISSETLVRVDPARLMENIGKIDCSVTPIVIVYLRPHHTWLISDYTQNVKIGRFGGSFESYFERSKADLLYAKVLAPWRSVFDDNLIVRSYNQAVSVHGDVVTDLRDALTKRSIASPLFQSESERSYKINAKGNWFHALVFISYSILEHYLHIDLIILCIFYALTPIYLYKVR